MSILTEESYNADLTVNTVAQTVSPLVSADPVCIFQGITLKMNDLNHCIVARIMHGGMIHRQGKKYSHAYLIDTFNS